MICRLLRKSPRRSRTLRFGFSGFSAVILMLILQMPLFSADFPNRRVRLTFTGDIMVHNSQLRRAWLGEDAGGNDKGYNFYPSFEWIAPYLQTSHLTVGNLETTLGGPNSAWITNEELAFREYQAYPCFTTPDSLAEALKRAGFHIMVTANNHCMDSRLSGAARTLDVLDTAGLQHTGTSRGGFPRPWRGMTGNFTVSLLSWTHSVNGLISSKGMERINVFNARGHDDRLKEMLQDIRNEAARSPDLLILFIHWGQEYMDEPDQYQKNLADLALEAGADIIIGSHPHTLQPVERRVIQTPEGSREAFIAWSLGNFISSQRRGDNTRQWVDGSAILNLEIEQNKRGKARVAAVEMVPVYVRWSPEDIRVISVYDGLQEGSREKYGLSENDMERLKAYDEWVPAQLTRSLGALPARQKGAAWRVDFPE